MVCVNYIIIVDMKVEETCNVHTFFFFFFYFLNRLLFFIQTNYKYKIKQQYLERGGQGQHDVDL